jgi:hypothetical protein
MPQAAALPPSVKKEPGDRPQQASRKYQDPGAQLSRRQAHIYHLLTPFIDQGAPEQSFKMEKWLTGCI